MNFNRNGEREDNNEKITVRELINELLDCNMGATVYVLVSEDESYHANCLGTDKIEIDKSKDREIVIRGNQGR